ncbi:hypothetical protein SMC26_40655 [Actinomadura fulvescens]
MKSIDRLDALGQELALRGVLPVRSSARSPHRNGCSSRQRRGSVTA